MLRNADMEMEGLEQRPEEGSSTGLLGVVWRRKWIILFITAVAIGLGYLVYSHKQPIYASTAQVLLIKKDRDNLPVSGVKGGGYQETLSTHMLLITSPLIVGRAVEDHELVSLRSLQYSANPIETIRGGLIATRAGTSDAPDPNVINLTYKGPDARDCATILDAIVASYQDHLGETYQDFSTETVDLITRAKDELHEQLSTKEASYRQFRQQAPLLWKGSEAENMHEKRMQEIEKARSALLVENSNFRAEIDAIISAIQRGGNQEALKLLVGQQKAPGATERENHQKKMAELRARERELLDRFAAGHPDVQAVRREMELLREAAGSQEDGSDYVAVYVGSLRERLKLGEQQVTELTALFEKEREAARAMANYQIEDETYRSDIARSQQMFNSVIKRLEEINLVKDYGGIKTQLLLAPGIGARVEPDLAVTMTLATVLGLIAGGGLGYLVDMADRRFRSPEEIRRELGLPILGHIPVIESDVKAAEVNGDAQMHPMLCTYYQPKGRTSEAYRAVRTALYFSELGEGHKVVQVTSPHPGDGKTTMATNLAISIANSGKRVLLLESDFRRPRVHTMFDLDNATGVMSVIAGEAEIPEVTRATPIDNLYAICCGPRPQNPAELLSSPKFQELLKVVREQFDFVVIDSPPLLAVTDASVIAPRVDGVLLVMRLTKHARAGARRATEILNTMGAKVLGIVVNGIGRGAAYGYGYGYGRGYGYGYGGYNYAYYKGRGYGYHEYSEDYVDLYYEDEEAEAIKQPINGSGAVK